MLTFPSAPNHEQHPPQTTGLASASPESQPSSSDAKTQLNWLLFKSPKSSAHASGAWRHSHPVVTFSIWGFYCDISECHVRSAREHLRSCLHLTNPCAKRKVLSLTKPKGKIYKTKFLGHYITCGFVHDFVIHSDHWGSHNSSNIFSTIWLLYCDQLYFHLSHNKCFWLLPRHYDSVRTRKA